MGERIGDRITLRTFLQVVVADFARRVKRLLDVARLEGIEHSVVVVSPHTGEEIRLKLNADTDIVGLRLVRAVHGGMSLVECPEEVLDVVADLVGYDVGIGEIAVRTEGLAHIAEKGEVDVETLVRGAIEGSDGGRGTATRTLDGIVVEDEGRGFVFETHFIEKFRPHVLRPGEDLTREAGEFLFLGGRGVGLFRLSAATDDAPHVGGQHVKRVAAGNPSNDCSDDYSHDTTADFESRTAATAPVTDV